MKNKFLILISMLLIVVAFVGCSTTNNNTNISEDNQNTETRVVTDIKGSVTIPTNPKRIVDISGASDILSILGYEVIGTANSDGYDYTKFPSYLEDVLGQAKILGYSMTAEIDIESIINLEPDLIIISTVQEKMYSQLLKIAPVIMIEMKQVDWKEDFLNVATIFEKEEVAKQWIENYLNKSKQVGDRIKEANQPDKTYLSFLASNNSIFIFDKAGLGTVLYDDMLLNKPTGMPQQENISLPVVTFEGLAAIDADYIFAIATNEDLKLLNDSSIWNSLPAVQSGNLITLPASPYFNQGYSPIGRMAFIEEVEKLLNLKNE